MALKLVHTADWHLGMTFPSFDADARLRLSRARLEAIDRVLGLAERHTADAVLCAGDLFDDPDPGSEWWEGLAKKLQGRRWTGRHLFLLPGNHDPLTHNGVYSQGHPFRAALPDWAHVVDRDDYCFELSEDAVLYAAPCRSKSESRDLALTLLPERTPGDARVRIGMVHGQTFDLPKYQMNFPIAPDAARLKGLDYLAIGDTHSYRDVTPEAHAPTVYPGTPEPTHFGEKLPGHAAVVYFPKDRRRRALVREEPVAQYTWEVLQITGMDELRALCARDLSRHVLRLVLDFRATFDELAEVERLLSDLIGTPASHGRAAALQVERERLELDMGSLESALDDAPDIIRLAARRLEAVERHEGRESERGEVARRALYQLYRLVREAEA
jgi:DNA repair exonuclease SbcCD nuclease subunit